LDLKVSIIGVGASFHSDNDIFSYEFLVLEPPLADDLKMDSRLRGNDEFRLPQSLPLGR